MRSQARDAVVTRVVYIAGDGRSGTTILSQILGSYDGCLAVGELYDFWSERLTGERICSCGAPLRDCVFWNAVMDRAFGEDQRAVIERAIALRASVQNTYHLPLMLFPRLRPASFDARLREFSQILQRLYTAIAEVSGCGVIVDSSKLAAYALALDESPSLDLSFIHVSRDSRACVFSWRRLKGEVAADGGSRYLPRRPVVQAALVWSVRNLVLAAIHRRFPVSLKLRYEDFVGHPRAEMKRVSGALSLEGHDRLWLGDSVVDVSAASHVFAGNPSRYQHGPTQIRADEEWRRAMPRRQQSLVYALTLPAMWQLGYLGGRNSPPEPAEPERLVSGRAG